MKVDAEYTDTKLTGAVFEVYKDSNDNGELDSEDELIGTLTEKEIGQYEMNDLLYGRYFILESASPDSYIRDEGVPSPGQTQAAGAGADSVSFAPVSVRSRAKR